VIKLVNTTFQGHIIHEKLTDTQKKLRNFGVTPWFTTDQFQQNFSNWVSHMKFNNKKEVFHVVGGRAHGTRKVSLLCIIRSTYSM
jgi:hypothetical protein